MTFNVTCLFLELIDTLWNVNIKQKMIKLGYEKELIDTLWNVNIKITFIYIELI